MKLLAQRVLSWNEIISVECYVAFISQWLYLSTELWPIGTQNQLKSFATGFLSLLKIRCDVDFLGIMWRIALQYCLYSLGSFESVLSKNSLSAILSSPLTSRLRVL